MTIKDDLNRWQLYGELPPAWEPEPPLPYCERCQANGFRCGICSTAEYAPEIDDARLEEMMREREALESGCLDDDDPRHPGHPVTCRRPCCRPVGWEP